MKFEVKAAMYGKRIIETESEEEIINVAAEMDFDDFNWDDLVLLDIKEVDR